MAPAKSNAPPTTPPAIAPLELAEIIEIVLLLLGTNAIRKAVGLLLRLKLLTTCTLAVGGILPPSGTN